MLPLATRVGDALYYTLPDPTAQSSQGSTSLTPADAAGNEVGHVIYDAYGAIVENTLPATLTAQGVITDHLCRTTGAGAGHRPGLPGRGALVVRSLPEAKRRGRPGAGPVFAAQPARRPTPTGTWPKPLSNG
jgi:hypothetical protein